MIVVISHRIVYFNPPTPRGVGRSGGCLQSAHDNFNPPTPRGVGPTLTCLPMPQTLFQSSHSARSGTHKLIKRSTLSIFQSSHSARSGTSAAACSRSMQRISILPLREEWDVCYIISAQIIKNFNPPTPRGVGLCYPKRAESPYSISILPLREEWDSTSENAKQARNISILPLREEWDPDISPTVKSCKNFNPPTPRGVGLVRIPVCSGLTNFNPPTPRGVGQQKCTIFSLCLKRYEQKLTVFF